MKSWGRYELVASPADADLVFELRFTAPIADFGKTAIYEPQLGLSIFDTKTHFVLWTLTEPVQGAFRKATWEKNVQTRDGESSRRDQKARRHSTLSQGGRAVSRICATKFLALYRHGHCVATAETQRRDATASIAADHFVD